MTPMYHDPYITRTPEGIEPNISPSHTTPNKDQMRLDKAGLFEPCFGWGVAWPGVVLVPIRFQHLDSKLGVSPLEDCD